eukprot:6889556-Prymnesium_polylepis.1
MSHVRRFRAGQHHRRAPPQSKHLELEEHSHRRSQQLRVRGVCACGSAHSVGCARRAARRRARRGVARDA